MLDVLRGKSVLIAEDEFLIATDLEETLSDAGAIIIGPAASLSSAMRFLDEFSGIDAAVLDMNLAGELCYPIADKLLMSATPFVICTGYEDAELPPQFKDVPRFLKPVGADEVSTFLSKMLSRPIA